MPNRKKLPAKGMQKPFSRYEEKMVRTLAFSCLFDTLNLDPYELDRVHHRRGCLRATAPERVASTSSVAVPNPLKASACTRKKLLERGRLKRGNPLQIRLDVIPEEDEYEFMFPKERSSYRLPMDLDESTVCSTTKWECVGFSKELLDKIQRLHEHLRAAEPEQVASTSGFGEVPAWTCKYLLERGKLRRGNHLQIRLDVIPEEDESEYLYPKGRFNYRQRKKLEFESHVRRKFAHITKPTLEKLRIRHCSRKGHVINYFGPREMYCRLCSTIVASNVPK